MRSTNVLVLALAIVAGFGLHAIWSSGPISPAVYAQYAADDEDDDGVRIDPLDRVVGRYRLSNYALDSGDLSVQQIIVFDTHTGSVIARGRDDVRVYRLPDDLPR